MSQTGGLSKSTAQLHSDANFDTSDGFHNHKTPPFYPAESTVDINSLAEGMIDSDTGEMDNSLSTWNINWDGINFLLNNPNSIPLKSQDDELPENIRNQLRRKYLFLIMRLNFIFGNDDRFIGLIVNLSQYTKYVEQNDLRSNPAALEESINKFIHVLRTTIDCLQIFIKDIPLSPRYKSLHTWCVDVYDVIASDIVRLSPPSETVHTRVMRETYDISEVVISSIFTGLNLSPAVFNERQTKSYNLLIDIEQHRSIVMRLNDFALLYARTSVKEIPEDQFESILKILVKLYYLYYSEKPTKEQCLSFINTLKQILVMRNPRDESNLSSDLNTVISDLEVFRQKYREKYSVVAES
jgi:hypothetical protein